jgi:hypothetical protein
LSIKQMIDIECCRCGSKGKLEVWNSINVQLNPEAMKKLLEGRINTFHCENCSFKVFVPVSLLYHDPLEKFCVEYVPFHWAKENKFLDSLGDDAKLDKDLGVPGNGIPEYFKNTHLVFSMDELARYVVFRHLLARRKLSIERGKLACFSCRRNIEKGEHHFCVSRLHRVRNDTDDMECDEIIGAAASLQVCADCMVTAAKDTIRFKNLPLPVLNLEKDGLHRFARWLTDKTVEWIPMAGSCDSCHFCHVAIVHGNKYILLEAEEEIESTECMEIKEKRILAVICEECSQKYAVWL